MNRLPWMLRAFALLVAAGSLAGCVGYPGAYHGHGGGYRSYGHSGPGWGGHGGGRGYAGGYGGGYGRGYGGWR